MKLLHTIITLGLLQLLTLKPLHAITSPKSTTLAQNKLKEFYENGMSLLAKDFCEKAKTLSEQILKDKIIQQASTPLIKEFKQNITSFLHNYPFFQRNDLFNKLLRMFSDITVHYYYEEHKKNPKDSLYILNLLKKQGYDTISNEYEQKFGEFIKQKFVPKFEEFKTQLSQEDLKKRQGLLDWFKELKKCQNYNCYYKYFNLLIRLINTPKEELFEFIDVNLERITIYYIISANDVVKTVLKDQHISQLTPTVRKNLLKDINEYMRKFESNTKLENSYDLILFFHSNISTKYYYNTKISLKDQQLLKEIFDKHGYDKFQIYNQYLFNDFVQGYLPKIFAQFKKMLSKEELNKESALFKWFEDLQKLQTYEERVKAFYKLYALKLSKKV